MTPDGAKRLHKTAAVIDYDLGNLPSVTKALERIGVDATIVQAPDDLTSGNFDVLVLPGVGHFGAGARNLRERGFDTSIKDWAASGKPLLGICVGLQLLMESSEEDPDEQGLGVIKGTVRKLDAPKVPHMGWNTLDTKPGTRIASVVDEGEMTYFVHSFYVEPSDPSVVAATTTYAETFCTVVEQDNVMGVQFHPEKSADVGRKVLEGFFSDVRRTAGATTSEGGRRGV
jgi:imidazole glycerol-phosphate synthase subunit HisH